MRKSHVNSLCIRPSVRGTAHQRPIFYHIPGTQYDGGQTVAIMSRNVASYVMRPLSAICHAAIKHLMWKMLCR